MIFEIFTILTAVFVAFFWKEYAQVSKMLGNGRLEALCFDGPKRLCHIRGKLRKKVCHNEAKSKISQNSDLF